MPRYNPSLLEPKWQQFWDEHQTFVTPNTPQAGAQGKLYVLDMFPYPSGSGLHVGHPEGYTATDIVVRYNRMRGKHVLHPMGWDAFGLPAEEHAVKTGTHPAVTTKQNIDTFRRQLKMLGFSYDWSRELSTTDPGYYRWTQWIFLQLYDTWYDPDYEWTGPDGKQRKGKGRPISELPIPEEVKGQGPRGKGQGNEGALSPQSSALSDAVRKYQDQHRLAYISEAPVNWCPGLGTVLANEEVIDGKSERGSHPVVRMPLKQWMLRITAYADRLANELEDLGWPDSIKALQRNWIGRSVGAEVDFKIASVRREPDGSPVSPALLQQGAHAPRSPFPKEPAPGTIRVYTTRPDTLFGVTYMVLAPEHPLVDSITTPEQRAAVDEYRRKASLKSDLDRTDLAKDKSGVFTGGYAINPVNGEQVPVWIADYVLISYGTGAIMAVPAHDERDWAFAQQYNIPIRAVVANPADPQPPILNSQPSEVFTELGVAINSGKYNGLPTAEFKARITADLAAAGLGKEAVNYRLRDWLFSRQRYWGEPFPIWHELDEAGNPTGLMRADTAAELPVLHPHMEDFKPTGTPEPMLAKAPDTWLYKTAADSVKLKRETNSMPQWAGSCWYYLRFCDNQNSERFIDPALEKYWLPVDLYVGGAEHAVLHLLYSRFWHKVLFDRGHVTSPEPFGKLVNQGMILGEAELTAYQSAEKAKGLHPLGTTSGFVTLKDTIESPDGEGRIHKDTKEPLTLVKLTAEQVEKQGGNLVLKGTDIVVESRSFKMSKSRGNVINPDDVVKEYGADSLRLYEMFMGPLEQVKPWSMSGVEGVYRFLARTWRMFVDERADDVTLHPAIQEITPTDDQLRVLHKTIKAVTEDIEKLSFNTAISRMMEFINEFGTLEPRPRAVLAPFALLLSPFAPHLAEELWSILGHQESLAYAAWPTWDEKYLIESEIEIPVQINGKLRAKILVPAGADAATLQSLAEANATIQPQLAGKQIVKVVAVPGRMVNFVVKG
ncbi:MAG: leucine--tRNA ligase [Planctomycetota bacterium]|nr:MAG: leucine--tRNA ligase [Planctomycetota bacterium]